MRVFLLILFLSLFSLPAAAAPPISKSFFGDIAIGGHDTVSYHSAYQARSRNVSVGSKMYVVKWMGANWRFASKASADRFEADPARYVPSYYGHCANALSLGEGLVKTDGSVWEFFDDQLYLFYAERGRKRWMDGDWRHYKRAADQAWQDSLTSSPAQ